MNITLTPPLTTINAGTRSGTFTVNVTAKCAGEYYVKLCSYNSNSFNYSEVAHIDDRTLIPHNRFTDINNNVITGVNLNNMISSYDTLGRITSVSESFQFYYTDDMPATSPRVILVAELINLNRACSPGITPPSTGTYSVSSNVTINSITPTIIKYTKNGKDEIPPKWTTLPISWIATLHNSVNGPIIFNATSRQINTSIVLSSTTSNCCTKTYSPFNKTTNPTGGSVSGVCVTDLVTNNAYVSGSTTPSIIGTSNTFGIRDFSKPPLELRKYNQSWDITSTIKSYALAPHININYNLWNNFIGSAIGGLESGQQIGRNVYEHIANFVNYNVDIDESEVSQLYSISQYLDVPIDDYNFNSPADIKNTLDMASLAFTKIRGEYIKCNLNITDNELCYRCGNIHSNLGTQITNPETYIVSANKSIVVHDIFGVNQYAWHLIEVPTKVLSGGQISDLLSVCVTGIGIDYCNTSVSCTDQVTSYALSTLLDDYNNTYDFTSRYNYYEYKDGFPYSINCDGTQGDYIQGAGVINWSDNYNTLSRNEINIDKWFDNTTGNISELLEYFLLKGLEVKSISGVDCTL